MDFIEDNASAAGQRTEALQTNNQEQEPLDTGDFSTDSEQKLTSNTELYPWYSSINQTSPSKFVSLSGLLFEAEMPSVGDKLNAAGVTPYKAQAKTKPVAIDSQYHALVDDHDDNNLNKEQITALFDQWGVAYLAFTTSSHQQEKQDVIGSRWKVVLPLAYQVNNDLHQALAKGLALLNDTDKAQARDAQVFFAPNKLRPDAPYDYIDETNKPFLDPYDEEHPLIKACLIEYEKQSKAEGAPTKPRTGAVIANAGLIEKIQQHYDLEQELSKRNYKRIGKKYLSPYSTTGIAGVIILKGGDGVERCYSHHGESDPLSNLNNDGHALDVVDVISILDFGGDLSRTIAALAPIVDPEGQTQRQRDYKKEKEAVKMKEVVDSLLDNAPSESVKPKSCDVDLLNPPGLAGEICKYMKLNARRDSSELYPLSALHLMALVGRKRKSILTDKLNLVTLGIAPTAAGKENAQDAVKRLAHDQHCSKYIHGNAGSFKELVLNIIDGHGSSLYVVDEIHSLLGSMKSKSAATYETKMEAEILTMTSTKLYTFRGMEKRSILSAYKDELKAVNKQLDAGGSDEEVKKLTAKSKSLEEKVDWLENGLPNPFFSLMGHSVPEKLDGFVSAENISSGFIGRTLVIRAKDTRSKLRRTPVDEGALTWCEQNIDRGLANVRRDNRIVSVDSDARIFLDECIDWFDDDEQLNHPAAGGIYARAPEHLYRVASILALDEGSITLEHAKYAYALVKHSIENIDYLLMKAYTDSDGVNEQHVIIHAKEVIHRNCKGQGLQLSRIKDLVTKPKGWKDMEKRDVKRDRFTELIELMLAEDELIKITDGRRVRYVSQAKG